MTSFFGWTIPPVVYTISYAGLFVGAAIFLVVVGRTHAPTARREPFRKPALVRATGLLLLSAAAILTLTFDGTGTTPITAPSWAIALQFGLGVAGIILVIVGGRAYKRAGDAYPPGKHADPETPPDGRRRWRLFRDYR